MTQTQFYSQQSFRGPGRLHAFKVHTDASRPPGGKVRPSLAASTKLNWRLNDERENNDRRAGRCNDVVRRAND